MEPVVIFGIQFTLSLAAYALIAVWYVLPRLSGLSREVALVPLLWIHAFRIVGGTILARELSTPPCQRTSGRWSDMATWRRPCWPSWP